ncbi:MAG TPA: cation transporter [Mycobacteriales bacterium]|nr:cation transporter [Mycobacteriales bacterium]
MTTTTYSVLGMSCEHCVNAVTAELSELAGVQSVEVDLGSGAVTVTSDQPLAPAAVAEAIDEAGYELAEPAVRS